MELDQLNLDNFRNHTQAKLTFDRRNIILGKNGTGKTNIIEAIHLLCTGKSFKALKSKEFILEESDRAIVFGRFGDPDRGDQTRSLAFTIQKGSDEPKKDFFKDSKKTQALKLLGETPVILFAPEELKIVWGTPKERRAILDLLIIQLDPKYAYRLFELSKVLKNRNRLLFNIGLGRASTKELDFWDQEFVELSYEITTKRQSVLEEVSPNIDKFYKEISGSSDTLEVKFTSSILRVTPTNPEEHRDQIRLALNAHLKHDLKRGYTSVGPHRDEIELLINLKPSGSYASRGEGRTATLALKFGQRELFKRVYEDQRCVFLFDDAFSELDEDRVGYLLDNLGDEQSIFTSTEPPDNIKKFNIINLK